MTSPICLVNGLSTTGGVDVTKNTTVTVELVDDAGVLSWELTCIGTDDILTTTVINSTLVVDGVTKTATFDMPDGDGYSCIFQSKVNQGQDINGRTVSSYTTNFKVSTLVNGNRTIAMNETIEDNSTYGWAKRVNNLIRSSFAATTFTTATSASAGSNGDVPAQVEGYIVVTINGVSRKIPYYGT